MDWPHLHLALNHVPVLGTAFLLLLLLTACWRRSDELLRLALGWQVGLTILAVPIKFTGDFANEAMGDSLASEQSLVQRHEQSADQATTGIFLAGVAAAVTLILGRKGRPLPVWGVRTTLALIVVTQGLMLRTASDGGKIRHPEIRSAGPPAASQPMVGP